MKASHRPTAARTVRRRWMVVVGLAIVAIALSRVSLDDLGELLRSLDPRLLPLLLLPLVVTYLAFYWGWQVLWPANEARARWRLGVRAFLVGEAANLFTPAQMGGEPIKVLALPPEHRRAAFASVVASRSLRVLAQLVFMAVALLLASGRTTLPEGLARALLVGGGALAILLVCFLVLQGFGLTLRLVSLAERLGLGVGLERRRWLGEADATLRAAYRRPWAVLASTSLAGLGWLAGASELWLVALAAGRPLSFADAVVGEGLALCVATLFFFVPAQVGMIEGARIFALEALGAGASLGLLAGVVRRLRHYLLASVATLYGGASLFVGDATKEGPGPATEVDRAAG